MSEWLSAERDDQHIVAWREDRCWRQQDFRRDVSQLIDSLQSAREQRWALCFEDSYYFAVALMALLYSGKTPVIPGHHRVAVLHEQRDEFDALLTDSALSLPCALLTLPMAESPPLNPDHLPPWPENGTITLFTSGSTGKPKRVIKPLFCFEQESQWLVHQWGNDFIGCRWAATVSHQHLYGLTFRLFLPLAVGLPFYSGLIEYHEQLIPMASVDRLVLISSPAFLKRLDRGLDRCHFIRLFSAGGPLDFETAVSAQASCGVLPTEIYGTTETGVIARRQQEHRDQPWQFFPGVDVTAALKNTDATENEAILSVKSALIPQPEGVELEDQIQRLADPTRFHLLGRKDRIVNIEEKKLSLSEIERRLLALPQIHEAKTLVLRRGHREFIAAVVVVAPTENHVSSERALGALTRTWQQQLRNWLDPVAIPRFWRVVAAIPINRQGKTDYAELQELFL